MSGSAPRTVVNGSRPADPDAMSTVHQEERKHRRTVLALVLACAATWMFALGHALPGAIGSEPVQAAGAAACAYDAACMRAAAPSITPAGAPATVQTALPAQAGTTTAP